MKEHVNLLFNPIFVVRLVCLGISSVNKAAEVCQVINKIQQLTDIICDRGAVGIHSLHMFFIHFTNTFHTLIHRFIVSVSSAFWPLGRLYQQDGVRHCTKVSCCSRCRLCLRTPVLFFFWCGPFLKVFIESVTTILLFCVLVFWTQGMWDLSFLTRDGTCNSLHRKEKT